MMDTATAPEPRVVRLALPDPWVSLSFIFKIQFEHEQYYYSMVYIDVFVISEYNVDRSA